jgi:hypothetical protein
LQRYARRREPILQEPIRRCYVVKDILFVSRAVGRYADRYAFTGRFGREALSLFDTEKIGGYMRAKVYFLYEGAEYDERCGGDNVSDD